MHMYSVRPVPRPKNQGSSASMAATEATPLVQASYPHDTFRATPTMEVCKDPFGVGRGTKGAAAGRAANPVPPRCC